ncbi:MAG TPA: hypothetical protein VNJ02_17595 [Vicinamibacterales bacterium]|nr:hypothetical protein [Vicinamibacterales bacterium]
MCGFSYTVFLSAFQLLPVAPYRILALGGSAASIAMGWIIERHGYGPAWATAAALASFAIPFFVMAEKRLLTHERIAP